MDNFEALIRRLLEQEGYWTRQAHKVNLTRCEKEAVGKPTMPRPEIDIIAFNPKENTIIAMEVKSYLDSSGVPCSELENTHDVPAGKYKLFTCQKYQDVVFDRLRLDLIGKGLANKNTKIKLGLAAGKVMKNRQTRLEEIGSEKGWLIWAPRTIVGKSRELAKLGYENDPFIILAKLFERNSE